METRSIVRVNDAGHDEDNTIIILANADYYARAPRCRGKSRLIGRNASTTTDAVFDYANTTYTRYLSYEREKRFSFTGRRAREIPANDYIN